METFAQKGDYSRHCSPPFKKKTRAHPLLNFFFWIFPDVIPDEAQQGPIPRQSFGYATAGARRHPCASQPDHKFTDALLLRSGSMELDPVALGPDPSG